MVYIDSQILAKSGAELFKELRRVYSVAEVEDYFKGGAWKDELIKMDLQLVYAHAREAGAPYPPPLSQVDTSDMPKTGGGGGSTIRPSLPMGGAVRPTLTVTPGATATGGPAAELRLIALFVAKWKLDLTRAKLILAKLSPTRRRYVIQHFKPAAAGPETTDALETFVTECEVKGDWDLAPTAAAPKAVGLTIAGPAKAAAAPKALTAPTVAKAAGIRAPGAIKPAGAVPLTPGAGVKRPLILPTVMEASKRPRITGPMVMGAGPRPGFGARPGMPTGVRPMGMGRPMGGMRPFGKGY